MEFLSWILLYALPASVATYFSYRAKQNRMVILHGFVILSILLLSLAGVTVNWNYNLWQIVIVGFAIAFSVYILKSRGLVYAVSSAIQQYCLLLAGILIIPVIGLIFGSILTSLPYTFTHLKQGQTSLDKTLLIIFCWGIASLLFYFWLEEPLYNIAIHIAGGSVLIHKELLKPNSVVQ